ncbi:bacterioferritin-associated ferredoxin [Aliikangiella sp. G2MR2-5]|uniref:bacterioferritin-associated ferredoxin n=1 Tax=Aliikangiella sp. G2MR2-5 TaxID=2788943 RepID=UPI0018AA75A2|nr:bacterioferritin-associated ferredoxin [Aliikangiella sp. G2MR2-5]
MYVCICNAVTDTQIIEAQQNGLKTMAQITEHLGVGNCCGRCVETAKEVLAENSGVRKFIPQMAENPSLVPA